MRKIILSIASLLITTGLQAQNNPIALSTDARIKQVIYQENNVVPVHGVTFTTTQIKFADKEQVLDIEGGDSAAWMITYHPELGNVIFVKPTLFDSSTNLTVLTNQHAYYFQLTSNKELERNPAQQTYALKFIYSQPKTAQTTAKQASQTNHVFLQPKVLNTAYRFGGSPQLVPLHVFDDGRFTYFELSPRGAVPAVFAVDDQSGKESTVNTRREGKYLIVQRLAPQFTLRQGNLATSVFNAQEISRIAANRRPK